MGGCDLGYRDSDKRRIENMASKNIITKQQAIALVRAASGVLDNVNLTYLFMFLNKCADNSSCEG